MFKIALSVEKDPHAHKTLELRAFYRQFNDTNRPAEYYEYTINPTDARREALFATYPAEARAARIEAWCHELCDASSEEVKSRAQTALGRRKVWVLIGGPPCQAYSLAGRSRRVRDSSFADDEKHVLYQHYLRLIQQLTPPIFVMENVKGILSARIGELSTIDLVLADLRGAGPGYDIYSFVQPVEDPINLRPQDFVIRSEEHGIPQARHRVILLGVRRDLTNRPPVLSPHTATVSVSEVIDDLPRLRSRISRRGAAEHDSPSAWINALELELAALEEVDPQTQFLAIQAVADAREANTLDFHKTRASIQTTPSTPEYAHWYCRDSRSAPGLNHASRSHMPSDLGRYLFCSCFAQVFGRSPKLSDFPKALLPAHRNIQANASHAPFTDRFRVQVADSPSTTITSHISKDGHYYIHHDPSQCRSLSVREAARLQTFPDDYFFEGNRTQQYHQVGNAVPPLLATQLAEVVAATLGRRYQPIMANLD